MNVSLTPELEQLVQAKVASGMYQTASEVIREGLRLLHERDELRERKLEELRRELDLGLEDIERGRVSVLNEEATERIKARGRALRAERAGDT